MSSSKKISSVAAVVILVAGGTVAGLELSDTTHWFHKPATQVITQVGKQTPATQPQSNASANTTPPPKSPQSGNSVATGSGTDTGGQTKASTNPSDWVVSKSGNITVKQPVADATLASGSMLVGSANVNKVHFTLIDNSFGQIATGSFNVVNGQFSGELNFKSYSSGGRLDVYSTTPDGRQLNVIEIAVRF